MATQSPPIHRAGGAGGALGNPSSYVVTGVPLTDIQADGETVRSGCRRPTRLSRPANGQSGFELRHYHRGLSRFGRPTSGRGSLTKPSRLGIVTWDRVRASRASFSPMMRLRYSRYAVTAYT